MLRMSRLHIFPVVTCIRIFLRQKNHTVSLQLSISGGGQHGKRAWEKYHINMPSWNNTEKDKFLSKWCSTRHQKNGMRKVFDLHCDNPDPWTWDSQWVYACWKNNGLSIIPSQNLVSNIGIGPDATNTKVKRHLEIFPERINQISFPLIHPIVELDQVLTKPT